MDKLKRRRRRVRAQKLTEFPLSKLFPNMVTLMGLSAGLFALKYGMQGQWKAAVIFVVIAAFIDGMDGRLARLLNASSNFGAQLDSLTDFFNFGVAPALIMYLWIGHEIRGLGWAMALFFIICQALRLARFNASIDGVDEESDEEKLMKERFFVGVPAPSGAGLCLLPMILTFLFNDTRKFDVAPFDPTQYPALCVGYMAIIALLMVSRIPTFSAKKIRVRREFASFALALAGLFVIGMVIEPWVMLPLMGIGYLALIPFSVLSYYRCKA